MKTLNVAILGQGRSGRDIHGAHLRGDERFRIVAVVDPLLQRRERAVSEYDIAPQDAYATYQELLGRRDIDLVINATPSHQHQPIAIDLMRHGFNVLQEKPIAATTAQVEELRAVIEQTGCSYMIFLQSRYNPQFVKVREVVQSGVLGRPVMIKIAVNGYARRWDWQTLQANVAGNLYNTGPHPLGHALELLDYYDGMPSVYCKMDRVNTFGDAEDFVKLILTAPQRPLIDVEISSCDAYPTYTFQVQGDRGGLLADNTHVRWRYFDAQQAPHQQLVRTPLANAEGLPAYCSEQLPWQEESWAVANITDNVFASATRRLYNDVYAHLVHGAPLGVQLRQVAQQVAVMEEAHRQNPLDRLP